MKNLVKMSVIAVGAAALFAGCGESGSTDRAPVPSGAAKPTPANVTVGNVNINMDEVRAAIKAWQKDRWNADAIVKARKANGKVRVDDLKVQAKYKDLQPMFDLLVADYVVYVNIIDSFADASNAGEAVAALVKSFSMDDLVKMTKDLGKAVDGAKAIKDKAGWKDALPIGKDMLTISALTASMTNAAGILKGILEKSLAK